MTEDMTDHHAGSAPANDRKAEIWAFVIALGVIAALVAAYLILGLAGVGVVMVAMTAIIFVVLVTITVGG